MYRRSTILLQKFRQTKLWRFASAVAEETQESEYSKEPEYPPLFEHTWLGQRKHSRRQWYDRIRNLPTVEEKLLEISNGYFGRNKKILAFMLGDLSEHYNTLPFRLFCTKTHLHHGLPECYNADPNDESTKLIFERVKPLALDAIRNVFGGRASLVPPDETLPAGKDKMNGEHMLDHLFRAITMVAVQDRQYLDECQVDYYPRCDAFWSKGYFPPDKFTKDTRKATQKRIIEKERNLPDDPVNFWFQYEGKPYMQVRSDTLLPAIVERDDPLCTTLNIPPFPYDPRTVGYVLKRRYATSVPGIWPADPFNCAQLSFYTRSKAHWYANKFGTESLQDALHGMGVIASFGWLMGLATHHGFTPYHEITYPMTTQTVVTNGQLWSFYSYQLNTVAMDMDVDENTHQNICWATNEQQLFETVDGNEVKGFNDKVLGTLIKFVTRKPQNPDASVVLRPYLRKANHTPEQWSSIQEKMKYNYANRPPSTKIRQTPLWEKIYKLKFQAKIE